METFGLLCWKFFWYLTTPIVTCQNGWISSYLQQNAKLLQRTRVFYSISKSTMLCNIVFSYCYSNRSKGNSLSQSRNYDRYSISHTHKCSTWHL